MFGLDPKKAGAETKADIGIFLVGAAVGGAADAVLNVAGFAEPFVFAGICGAGALGVKKLIDARRTDDSSKDSLEKTTGDDSTSASKKKQS